MGLDIYQKKNKNSDFRMNWTAVRYLKSWCIAYGLPDPFPGWHGSNGGEDLDKTELKKWLKGFEKVEPNFSKMTCAAAMRDICFILANPNDYKDEEKDFTRITAINWYFYAKEGLKKGFEFS